MRISRFGWAAVVALVTVVMVSQVALAQRGEGRRGQRGFGGGPGGGGGMMSAMQLVANEQVQTILKLSDEQKDKVRDITDGLREESRRLFQGGRDQDGDRAAMREKMQELNAAATKKLNDVLDEGQQKRLMGVQIQLVGANALMDPAIANELNVTQDQKQKLEEVSQSNRDAMRELFEGARDAEGGREAMREKMEKQRDEANKKLLAVLTSDQQAQFESLKGEKIDLDMAALRGPGGGPGGRFGDRPRGERGERGDRGGRQRGERNPEANN